MILRPFGSYYGAKWRIARMYPKPRYDTVVECFAGMAGYALHYHKKKVRLYDVNPVVYGVWDYLIKSSREDVLKLPLEVIHLDELTDVCQEAKWLIGFWLSKASATPAKKTGAWMRKESRLSRGYWGPVVRNRIARQVGLIKHWKVFNKSYEDAPDIEATWFVDPPYSGKAGKTYPFHDIDYQALGRWCQGRRGQVIACDGPEGDWLPFKVLTLNNKSTIPGKDGKAVFRPEMVWTKSDRKVGFGLS